LEFGLGARKLSTIQKKKTNSRRYVSIREAKKTKEISVRGLMTGPIISEGPALIAHKKCKSKKKMNKIFDMETSFKSRYLTLKLEVLSLRYF